MAGLEALDTRGPVLGLRCSDPLVDAEVHHGHGVLGDSGAAIILGRVPRQLTVVRPHLQSMIDRRIKMYNFITT